MEASFENIRKNIYQEYEEDYLKQILIDFYKQQLNLLNFIVHQLVI